MLPVLAKQFFVYSPAKQAATHRLLRSPLFVNDSWRAHGNACCFIIHSLTTYLVKISHSFPGDSAPAAPVIYS